MSYFYDLKKISLYFVWYLLRRSIRIAELLLCECSEAYRAFACIAMRAVKLFFRCETIHDIKNK